MTTEKTIRYRGELCHSIAILEVTYDGKVFIEAIQILSLMKKNVRNPFTLSL